MQALEPAINAIPLEPQIAFAELGQIKLGDHDLPAVLGRAAELARQTLPGTADVSVTIIDADQATTAAFTGQNAWASEPPACSGFAATSTPAASPAIRISRPA